MCERVLTIRPDPNRPGQFVTDLLTVAEHHAQAAGDLALVSELLLAAAIAAAERSGTARSLASTMLQASVAIDRRHGRLTN
jgi:hypothetical protein